MTSCACVKAGDVLLGTRDRTVAQLCLLLSWTQDTGRSANSPATCAQVLFLNTAAKTLWPYYNNAVGKMVLEQVGPALEPVLAQVRHALPTAQCAGSVPCKHCQSGCTPRRQTRVQATSMLALLHLSRGASAPRQQHARQGCGCFQAAQRTPPARSVDERPCARAQTPLLQAIDIEAIDLGTKPPALGGVKSYSSSSDEATIEATLMWGSDARMRVGARVGFESLSLYIPVEVTNVQARAAA